MPRGTKYKYEEYHKKIDGILYKRCAHHMKHFNEEAWLPCTEEYYYTNDKNKTTGLCPECKKCTDKNTREWQSRNWDKKQESCRKSSYTPKTREYHRENSKRQRDSGYKLDYDRNNKDKQKLYRNNHRKHDITKSESEALLKVFGYKCAYCDITLDEHKKLHKEKLHDDHVEDNGYNDVRNDVPACKTCNTSKHTEDMETWFRRQPFFTEEKLQKILWWISEGYKNYIEDKPPYRIIRKQNKGLSTYHFNLWIVDEKRNTIDIIYSADKKKDILKYINDNNII